MSKTTTSRLTAAQKRKQELFEERTRVFSAWRQDPSLNYISDITYGWIDVPHDHYDPLRKILQTIFEQGVRRGKAEARSQIRTALGLEEKCTDGYDRTILGLEEKCTDGYDRTIVAFDPY